MFNYFSSTNIVLELFWKLFSQKVHRFYWLKCLQLDLTYPMSTTNAQSAIKQKARHVSILWPKQEQIWANVHMPHQLLGLH